MSESRRGANLLRACVFTAVIAGVVLLVVRLSATPSHHQPPLPLTSAPPTLPKQGVGPQDPLAAGEKVALGVNLDPITAATINGFARLVGARPRIVMWFQQWSEPLFYPQQLEQVAAAGAAPMITWDPLDNGTGIPLSAIASGRYDAYLRSAAEAAALWKRRIYIRFAHEMNLKGAGFGPGHEGDTPATFIAAWRHVVTVFRRIGASNVEWVWSPNTDCNGACPFSAFYPGDYWVDWVALDGYNYSSINNDAWMSFSQIFAASYATLAALTDKPMMIGETATVEDGGNKAQWISGMGRSLATQFTRVRAVIWFQRIKEADWRVNSSTQSLKAFRRLVHTPSFRSG